MAAIQFTIGGTPYELRNRFAGSALLQQTGGRFSNWIPLSKPVGDTARRKSDGALFRFRERDDFGASFELRDIAAHQQGGLFMVEIADLLSYHLQNGGQCSVLTEDNAGSTYATCGLLDGATPALTMQDAKGLAYTLSLAVVNLATPPVRMIARYGRV